MYDIRFTRAAESYFRKLKDKQLSSRFQAALELIARDPYVGELKRGDLVGVYCFDVHYQRTNYEVAYTIREVEDRVVVIILAGTREDFYLELKRYMK